MIFNLSINQKTVIDNNWDLGLDELAVFDVMHKIFTTFPNLKSIIHENKEWYWIDYGLIQKELPLLRHKDNWFRDAIKKLRACGLIDINPDNQKMAKTFYRMGVNSHKMFSNSDFSNSFPQPLPKPIEVSPTSTQTSGRPLPISVDYNSTNYKVVEEVGEKPKIENEDGLPTLSSITELSNIIWKDQLWKEQIIISTGLSTGNPETSFSNLFKWMKIFNLHISNTEDIRNINARKYKSLFIGWLRMKKSLGVKLSDFTVDSSKEGIKNQLAAPLRRL